MIYDSFNELLIKVNEASDEWPILWDSIHGSDRGKEDKWLEVAWHPNGYTEYGLGYRTAMDQGFFRVRVCSDRNGATVHDCITKAEKIRYLMRAGRELDCAVIVDPPEISSFNVDDDEVMRYLTITIRYEERMLK